MKKIYCDICEEEISGSFVAPYIYMSEETNDGLNLRIKIFFKGDVCKSCLMKATKKLIDEECQE